MPKILNIPFPDALLKRIDDVAPAVPVRRFIRGAVAVASSNPELVRQVLRLAAMTPAQLDRHLASLPVQSAPVPAPAQVCGGCEDCTSSSTPSSTPAPAYAITLPPIQPGQLPLRRHQDLYYVEDLAYHLNLDTEDFDGFADVTLSPENDLLTGDIDAIARYLRAQDNAQELLDRLKSIL